jgi:hypothetical protein
LNQTSLWDILINFNYVFFYPPDETDGDAGDDEVAGGDGKVVSGDNEVTGGDCGVTYNDKTTSQPPGGALLHRTVH